jgi:hypothetical protein
MHNWVGSEALLDQAVVASEPNLVNHLAESFDRCLGYACLATPIYVDDLVGRKVPWPTHEKARFGTAEKLPRKATQLIEWLAFVAPIPGREVDEQQRLRTLECSVPTNIGSVDAGVSVQADRRED